MRKPAIPVIPGKDKEIEAVLRPIKETLEMLTGVRGGRIERLSKDATISDVITKLNEVIDRINYA